MNPDLAERAGREVEAMIAEADLPEIDAVAEILLVRAWFKGYEAAAAEHLASLGRIQAKL